MLWTLFGTTLLRHSDEAFAFASCILPYPTSVNPRYNAFVPKEVAIKMNLLLYRILKEQIDIEKGSCFVLIFLIEHMFSIFVRIVSLKHVSLIY